MMARDIVNEEIYLGSGYEDCYLLPQACPGSVKRSSPKLELPERRRFAMKAVCERRSFAGGIYHRLTKILPVSKHRSTISPESLPAVNKRSSSSRGTRLVTSGL